MDATKNHSEFLIAALEYARRGWPVLPVKPKEKIPLIKDWPGLASVDPEKINSWWKQWPTANIGLLLGQKSGLVVLDIDGKTGFDRMKKLHLPGTITATSGKDHGWHYFFKAPDFPVKRQVRLFDEIDLLAENSFVIVAPSIHPSGRPYKFNNLTGQDPAPLPKTIIDLLERKPAAKTSIAETGEKIPNGQRNETMTSLAGKLRRAGLTPADILAVLSERNKTLCDPPLPESEVERIARSVGKYEPAADFDESRLTDLGLCQRFVKEHGDKLRFCPNLGDWLIWDGCRWAADDRDRVFQLAKKTVRHLYREAADSKDELYRKAVSKFAIASEAANRIAAFLTLAKRELTIPIRDLDADPVLLNCKTAVINFRTGEILPPAPEMMITMTTGTAYDPNAKCPLWLKTLNEIFEGDKERIRGFQKAKGYSLLGENQERKLIIDNGTGANGKSVADNTQCNLLGDYGCNIPAYSLMVTFRPDAIRNDLAMLKGKRFVLASEGPKNSTFSDDTMKLMAGGADKITSRFLNKEFFTYKPSFTVFLMTNHLPKVDADDPAIWDRIIVFPFNRRFEEHERNLKLETELIPEWPGILNWLIEGAWLARNEGLGLGGIPEIATATKEYREKQDLIGRFISDACEVNRDFSCRGGVLWEHFGKWLKENQEKDQYTQNRFADGMKRLGFNKERKGGKVIYFGIKPVFDEPPADAYGENS